MPKYVYIWEDGDITQLDKPSQDHFDAVSNGYADLLRVTEDGVEFYEPVEAQWHHVKKE